MDLRDDLKYYGKLAQRKVGYVAGQLELTSECFQHCVACDSWRADVKGEIKGTMSLSQVREICSQLDAIKTFEHLSFTGGDPQRWPWLEEFLRNYRDNYSFTLQMNSAFAHDGDWDLYRHTFDRLRISLDGVTPETYRRMRGVQTDPETIIERMEKANHPMLATNTCVTDINIDEIPAIIARLNAMKSPPRKAMFLAVLDFHVNSEFWGKYARLKDIPSPNVQTSFSEDVAWVRGFTLSEEANQVACHSGSITFHIKCDGDLYPCCLVGGEAIKTRKEMAVGNVFKKHIAEIHRDYRPGFHYANKESACVAVCQYKQLQVNLIGHEAKKTILTMP